LRNPVPLGAGFLRVFVLSRRWNHGNKENGRAAEVCGEMECVAAREMKQKKEQEKEGIKKKGKWTRGGDVWGGWSVWPCVK
jgi:hypothetical protein